MPAAQIMTNAPIEDKKAFLKNMSAAISEVTGKPEAYIMCSVQDNVDMIMSMATEKPCCFITFSCIGVISATKNRSMSEAFSSLMQKTCGVSPERCYINFVKVERENWGFNGSTF
ncbi:Macrophage migration inhibitory factor [Carpediemonas membranifera]|uniref:L-dopachrome isomerase n=1 Tax=Carpediemonas membranifera TaxID=201153 RepID=A0A8J6E4P8_9EUKA|nr:Macrophage migration inhibitory factor [Carpediemonas membranifera]|eukprot:KAG9394777.1 Macrophage migration inhibitory factor [Carpediemonas membranifera]